MDKKKIFQVGFLVLLLALVGWLILDMFGPQMGPTPDSDTSGEVITQVAPPPKKVTLSELKEDTKAIHNHAVELIANDVTKTLSSLRAAQLNAEIALALADKREADGRGSGSAARGDSVHQAALPISQPSLTGNALPTARTPYETATLTYFDYSARKAFLRVNGRMYSAFEGMEIANFVVGAFSPNGLQITKGSKTRTLIAPKSYSVPKTAKPQPEAVIPALEQ